MFVVCVFACTVTTIYTCCIDSLRRRLHYHSPVTSAIAIGPKYANLPKILAIVGEVIDSSFVFDITQPRLVKFLAEVKKGACALLPCPCLPPSRAPLLSLLHFFIPFLAFCWRRLFVFLRARMCLSFFYSPP